MMIRDYVQNDFRKRRAARAKQPVVTSKSQAMRWIERRSGSAAGAHPRDFDPEFVKALIARMGLLFGEKRRWFRVDVRGWETVPPSPVLVVSNHSGGTLILDTWGFAYAWHTHFQCTRPLHVLGHELLFSFAPLARIFARAGVLRAEPELATRVLVQWRRDLLVMPGGDLDVWRPYAERYKVKFAGHHGYVRLALKARVPIVPVANAGAHETLRVLSDGAALARLLRLPKLFRARIFPVHLSIPWGLAIGPWPHIAPPARLRYRIGPPVFPEGDWPPPGEEPSEDIVAAYDRRVQNAVQMLLDSLEADARVGANGRPSGH